MIAWEFFWGVDMITEFTPFLSFAGGLLIGLAAVILMATNGRVAGVSGILGGLFSFDLSAALWRISFIAGLVIAPYIYIKTSGSLPEFAITSQLKWLIVGGLLVGFGSGMGKGCTSGHGVCGIARLSKRSLVATSVFMISAAVMVFLMRHTVYM